MKALFSFAATLLCVIFLCAPAGAVPYTWTDVVDPEEDIYFSGAKRGGVDSYSYTHDITDDGFDVYPEDYVSSYDLTIELYDDGKDWCEVAFIDLPGFFADEKVEIDYYDVDLGMSFAGWVSLNLYGVLDVTIDRLRGDFYFGSSTLVAYGDESNPAAPVPEPATLLLLGTGMVGLAGFSRKKIQG